MDIYRVKNGRSWNAVKQSVDKFMLNAHKYGDNISFHLCHAGDFPFEGCRHN
jgi:hypothetical protein